MKLINGSVTLRDQVVGQDSAGRPVAGEVLEIDPNNTNPRVLISPFSGAPVWVAADKCARFGIETDAPPAAPKAPALAPVTTMEVSGQTAPAAQTETAAP